MQVNSRYSVFCLFIRPFARLSPFTFIFGCFLLLSCYSSKIKPYICGYKTPLEMKKVTRQAKEPVRLRTKRLANGCESLYFDIYTGGRRSYEFLKMYLVPERTPADKVQNAETLRTANAIQAQRIIELQNDAYGFTNSKARGNIDFVQYVERLAEKKAHNREIKNAIHHLKQYRPGIKVKQVDKAYLLGFIDYLNRAKTKTGNPLRENTKWHYFGTVRTALNRAVSDDLIRENPANRIDATDKPQKTASNREYLTLDEVKRIAAIPCTGIGERVRRAFLFSCFCGLRFCDIRRLRWCDIQTIKDGRKQIEITQQKTGEPLYLPLSDNALHWLPERGTAPDNSLVFALPVANSIGRYLRIFCKAAEIKKRVTFHVARHTNATLLLSYGVDIYTVSKLLGHTSVKTTQIYAKVIDENKRRAVDKIPSIL